MRRLPLVLLGSLLALGCGVKRPIDDRPAPAECSKCHASPSDDTFVDLGGSSDPMKQTVGAHQAHLDAMTFRAPLQCSECHLVPDDVNDPGHIDTPLPAEVFAQGSGLAWADGATVAYDRTANTCTNYCHGGGATLSDDAAPGVDRSPAWAGAVDSVQCGSCHGLPPQDGSLGHSQTDLNGCVQCHGRSVDASGAIKFETDPATGIVSTTHMNGEVTGNR